VCAKKLVFLKGHFGIFPVAKSLGGLNIKHYKIGTCSSLLTYKSSSCIMAGFDFIQLKCSDTSMAEHNILSFIIVKKWLINKPLALKATVHWLLLTKRVFGKVE